MHWNVAHDIRPGIIENSDRIWASGIGAQVLNRTLPEPGNIPASNSLLLPLLPGLSTGYPPAGGFL
jgi:hypothetical protein